MQKTKTEQPEILNNGNHQIFNSLSSESISYNSSGYVMYNLDFRTGEYIFMSPNIKSLTGYTRIELNEKGFKNIVKKIYSKKLDRYKINGGRDLIVEEYYAKYLIEIKSGELRRVEDN